MHNYEYTEKSQFSIENSCLKEWDKMFHFLHLKWAWWSIPLTDFGLHKLELLMRGLQCSNFNMKWITKWCIVCLFGHSTFNFSFNHSLLDYLKFNWIDYIVFNLKENISIKIQKRFFFFAEIGALCSATLPIKILYFDIHFTWKFENESCFETKNNESSFWIWSAS